MEGCKQANKNVRDTLLLEEMYDIKGWLIPYINTITGHSTPHIFRFSRGADGNCVMRHKDWHGDEWEPELDKPGLTLLNVSRLISLKVIYIAQERYIVYVVSTLIL